MRNIILACISVVITVAAMFAVSQWSIQTASTSSGPVVVMAGGVSVMPQNYNGKGKAYTYQVSVPHISGLPGDSNARFNADMDSISGQIVKEFSKPEKEIYDNYQCDKTERFISYEVASRSSFGVISIRLYDYIYTCGAHGSTNQIIYNIDIKSGEDLTYNDVFVAGADSYFNAEILKVMARSPDEYFMDQPENVKVKDAWFYFEGDNIIFVFGQYQIAPYSTGMPEFTFDKNTITRFLKIK